MEAIRGHAWLWSAHQWCQLCGGSFLEKISLKRDISTLGKIDVVRFWFRSLGIGRPWFQYTSLIRKIDRNWLEMVVEVMS